MILFGQKNNVVFKLHVAFITLALVLCVEITALCVHVTVVSAEKLYKYSGAKGCALNFSYPVKSMTLARRGWNSNLRAVTSQLCDLELPISLIVTGAGICHTRPLCQMLCSAHYIHCPI